MPTAHFSLLFKGKPEELHEKSIRFPLGTNIVIATVEGDIVVFGVRSELTPEEQQALNAQALTQKGINIKVVKPGEKDKREE